MNLKDGEIKEILDWFDRPTLIELREKSIDTWRTYWYTNNHVTAVQGIDGEEYKGYNWISSREIRVFRTPEIRKELAAYVIKGVEDLIEQVGLKGFSVINYDIHSSVTEQVKLATSEDGTLDKHKLGEILVAESWRQPELGGKPHADVIITDKYFSDEEKDWGWSQYTYGFITLALPDFRQIDLDFIRNLSKHEASHLFGFYDHHSGVNGYKKVPDCNMNWAASTFYTCDSCLEALKYFWLGIENRTGEKFFKEGLKLEEPVDKDILLADYIKEKGL